MNPALPPDLRAAIARRLQGVSRRDLAAAAAALSGGYRAGEGSLRHAGGGLAVAAYLAARLPATYAAAAAALDRLAEAAPDFRPATLLDCGAGPGGASVAACETFPTLAGATLLDHNPAFREAAAGLLADGRHAALRGAAILAGDVTRAELPPADLVLSAYALVELAEAALAPAIGRLWQAATSALLLVEPGTPEGFRRLRLARDVLLAAGARLAAPCPHEQTCPMQGEDWCHFSVRLPRLRDHLAAKQAEVPFEDERFAYLAVMRGPASLPAARILASPRPGKPGTDFKLCTPQGLARPMIPTRDKESFRLARRLDWGDVWPGELNRRTQT